LDKYTQKNSDFRKGKIDFMADRLITPNLKVVFEVDRLVWLFPVFRNLEIFLIPCIGFSETLKRNEKLVSEFQKEINWMNLRFSVFRNKRMN